VLGDGPATLFHRLGAWFVRHFAPDVANGVVDGFCILLDPERPGGELLRTAKGHGYANRLVTCHSKQHREITAAVPFPLNWSLA
jgi:hypothetical protein